MVVIDEWQIQDLPEDGAPTAEEGALICYFANFSAKNYIPLSLFKAIFSNINIYMWVPMSVTS